MVVFSHEALSILFFFAGGWGCFGAAGFVNIRASPKAERYPALLAQQYTTQYIQKGCESAWVPGAGPGLGLASIRTRFIFICMNLTGSFGNPGL
jgi:hypothetical protein